MTTIDLISSILLLLPHWKSHKVSPILSYSKVQVEQTSSSQGRLISPHIQQCPIFPSQLKIGPFPCLAVVLPVRNVF